MIKKPGIQITFFIVVTFLALILFIKVFFDERRLSVVNNSFTELYADRLLPERSIYTMNDLIYKKMLLLKNMDPAVSQYLSYSAQKELTTRLQKVFKEFLQTKLSAKEQVASIQLQNYISNISTLEAKQYTFANNNDRLMHLHNKILVTLEALSDIQIEEGSKLRAEGQEYLAFSLLGLKLQTGIYIILMISFLALVRTLTISSRILQKHELN